MNNGYDRTAKTRVRLLKEFKEKIKGKRVFLKYDEIKYDSENYLLCYLYLENKTFINAHLLKKEINSNQ